MSIEPVNPTMTRDELVAAAESIGMRFPAPVAPEGEPTYAELQAMNEEQVKTIRNLRGVMSQWASTGAPAPVLTPAQAHADELVAALSDIAHGLEHARIWGGMKWEYNPLHPIHYVPLRDKASAVLAKIEATGKP